MHLLNESIYVLVHNLDTLQAYIHTHRPPHYNLVHNTLGKGGRIVSGFGPKLPPAQVKLFMNIVICLEWLNMQY